MGAFAAVRRVPASWNARWQRLPLRTRLTTAAAAAATLAILAVIAVAYLAVRHELRGQVDRQLRHQASELTVDRYVDPFSGNGSVRITSEAGDIGGYKQIVDASGRHALLDSQGRVVTGDTGMAVSATDVKIAAAGGGPAYRDTEYRGLHVRSLTTAVPGLPGYALQIAVPLTAVDYQLRRLAIAFAVLAVAGLTLTVLASWAAVRRVTRPVRTLTETAEQIAATRDLTVRIAAEGNDELGRLAASFNTMLDALERSVGAQRQLVLDASHELRTPLASLRTNVEVLNDLDRLPPAERSAVLAGIVTQLDELTGLVADVVELARGEVPPGEHVDVALDDLVARAVQRAARHWPAVRFDLHAQPVTVRGVPGRLDRAVANLLDNAGKFSPGGATVDVTVTPSGTVTVRDRGPGVPADALPHVFDRFYRADEARALPGSGLGLAIVQQVADGHGGTIEVRNAADGGTVATLRLPPTSPDDTGATAAAPPAAADRVPMPVEESLFR